VSALSRTSVIALQRLAYRAAHRGLRLWWFVRRPRTAAVKCFVRDGDRVLFVRHTYGRRGIWELPGGGLRRGEQPSSAVRREMREELSLDLEALREVGTVEVSGDHKRTRIVCFEADAGRAPLRLARAELAEAVWAAPSAPPRPLGADAARLLRLIEAPPIGLERSG
jgi:ADP-ribose pyrophosphatase YjhB (NUDIX family)